jgi:uncharacterized protein (UPF0303 family)
MAAQVPELDRFTHDEAWRTGAALVARCRAERLPVTIAIWLGQQRVFHAALPGTSADNDAWVEKKARVVHRFGRSSLEVFEHYDVGAHARFHEIFGLSRSEYAPGEGAIPIKVRGSLVGVLAVSGLEGGGDHDLAVSGLEALVG